MPSVPGGNGTFYVDSTTSNVWFSPTTTPVSIISAATTTATTAGSWVNFQPTNLARPPVAVPVPYVPDYIKLEVGKERNIEFPDGTIITFRADGSFVIYDKDAKVIYKAHRTRDFNPFINASDKLEEFIQYCGTVGVRQGDMLGIPIKHFVQWLVIEAARADGESTSEVLALTDYSQPRCRVCARFMSPKLKEDRIEFCRPSCFTIGLEKAKERGNEKHHQYDQTLDPSSPQTSVGRTTCLGYG